MILWTLGFLAACAWIDRDRQGLIFGEIVIVFISWPAIPFIVLYTWLEEQVKKKYQKS